MCLFGAAHIKHTCELEQSHMTGPHLCPEVLVVV